MLPIYDLVSIPQGTINTAIERNKKDANWVSIPQGTINT